MLEDNLRIPSGLSYVIENRRAMTQRASRAVRRATGSGRSTTTRPGCCDALRAAAPAGVTDPTVVVLTPGVYNAAYFEHALLARLMGVELVEGRDLVCRDNVVCDAHDPGRAARSTWSTAASTTSSSTRCTSGPTRCSAARASSTRPAPGNVTIANAVGNGVADDKLIYTYVPELIRYYLGEEPLLDNVETYRLDDRDARAWVLDRLDELVLKPVDGSGGKGIVIGPQATDEELHDAARRDRAPTRAAGSPSGVVQLSHRRRR